MTRLKIRYKKTYLRLTFTDKIYIQTNMNSFGQGVNRYINNLRGVVVGQKMVLLRNLTISTEQV